MEQQQAEHEQLRTERDTLADCVRSLQELQQQPPAPTDIRAQVTSLDEMADCCTNTRLCPACGTQL